MDTSAGGRTVRASVRGGGPSGSVRKAVEGVPSNPCRACAASLRPPAEVMLATLVEVQAGRECRHGVAERLPEGSGVQAGPFPGGADNSLAP